MTVLGKCVPTPLETVNIHMYRPHVQTPLETVTVTLTPSKVNFNLIIQLVPLPLPPPPLHSLSSHFTSRPLSDASGHLGPGPFGLLFL